MQALAEDVGLPQPFRVGLKVAQKALHQILALLFGAHDGVDLGVDHGLEHVDGGGTGFQADTVPPALPDDLRFFERKLVDGGHHDAVSGSLHLFQRTADLFIFASGSGKLNDAGHQARFIADGKAGLLAEHPVEHIRLEQNGHPHDALREIHAAEGGALHRIAGKGSGAVLGRDILHAGDLLRKIQRGRVDLRLEPVAPVQHGDPARDGKIQLPHRELVEHPPQDLVQGGAVQVDAAHGQHTAPIRLLHLRRKGLRFRGVRVGAVEQDDKGLAQRFQLLHDPLFGGKIVFPRDLADGAVGGDDDADGGVIPDDLAGAGLGGKVKGDLFLKPGAFDHAGLFVLLVAHGPLHHIPHAVDEADAALTAALQLEWDGVLRDELRLGRHDGAPRRRLGQFVPCTEAGIVLLDGRQHQLLHELLDEGALAGAHRAHHSDQDLAAGACTDLAADRGFQTFLLFQNGFLLSASGVLRDTIFSKRKNRTLSQRTRLTERASFFIRAA